LGTDWIDLFQLHHPSNEVPIDEPLRALDDLIRAGKVRYAGVSSFAAWQIVESLWAAKEYGLHRVVSEQPAYNLLDRRVERELLPMARSYGIAVLPWSPLAGGLLAGRYQRGQPPPAGSRLAEFWAGAAPGHLVDRAFDVIEAVGRIADARGATRSQVALAWCLAPAGGDRADPRAPHRGASHRGARRGRADPDRGRTRGNRVRGPTSFRRGRYPTRTAPATGFPAHSPARIPARPRGSCSEPATLLTQAKQPAGALAGRDRRWRERSRE
jgi:hypothetical protein